MLKLCGVHIWDTGEAIDCIIDGPDAKRSLVEPGSVSVGGVDASGLTLAPGLTDPHVHFRDPGQTEKETMVTGAQAAASGGYTDVLIMPNTEPAADGERVLKVESPGAYEVKAAGVGSVLEYLDAYEAERGVKLPVRYALSICATVGRRGRRATSAADIAGFGGLRHRLAAITDDGSAISSETLSQVLATSKATGLPVLEHCEHHENGVMNEGAVNRDLGVPGVPASTELAIVERDIDATRRTGVHIHFQHVSTAAAFDAIRKAKAAGLPVTCETAPHYLALCDEDVQRYGAMAKMNPPLRSRADREATLQAVSDGTVDMIATDHAPHTDADKAGGLLDAPNGIIGLETAYGVCHAALVDAGIISERRLVELMSIAPVRLMGSEPTDIRALLDEVTRHSPGGVDRNATRVLDLRTVEHPEGVNLVLLDNSRSWTIDPSRFHSKARNTPFAGWSVTGLPLATVLGGKLCMSRIPCTLVEAGSG